MQLADAVWRRTEPDTTASAVTWEQALEDVRSTVDNGFERLHSLLPPGHQKTLRVVAGGGSLYGTAADAVSLSPGTAKAAVDALIGNGFLHRDDEGVRVIDPLLTDWLRRRFPV